MPQQPHHCVNRQHCVFRVESERDGVSGAFELRQTIPLPNRYLPVRVPTVSTRLMLQLECRRSASVEVEPCRRQRPLSPRSTGHRRGRVLCAIRIACCGNAPCTHIHLRSVSRHASMGPSPRGAYHRSIDGMCVRTVASAALGSSVHSRSPALQVSCFVTSSRRRIAPVTHPRGSSTVCSLRYVLYVP